jgi:RING-variant domain
LIKFNQGLKISEGDCIKLGRIRFKIKELKLESGDSEKGESKPKENVVKNYIQENGTNFEILKEKMVHYDINDSQKSSGTVCRICLSDEESEAPLVSPCKCSGSMQYIHIHCMQKWLASKLKSKSTSFSVSFSLKNFECELCKTMLPRNQFSSYP